jgi:LuxR family glucitol operon transcriptional activator
MKRSRQIDRKFIPTVKEALATNGFSSQESLARKAGLSRDTISKFLNGKPVNQENFITLCKMLSLDPEEVCLKPRNIPNNLPHRTSPKFIGRKIQQKKLFEFLSPDERIYIITVDGIAGVGKTSLVVEVAHHCLKASQDDLPDLPQFEAIVFTSAKLRELTPTDGIKLITEKQCDLNSIFREIANTLQGDTTSITEEVNTIDSIHNTLKKQTTLLIIDNLETVENRSNLMDFLRRLPEQVKSIITTREVYTIDAPIKLTELTKEETLELIDEELKTKNLSTITPEQKNELCEATGGIPLVIVYAIGCLANGSSFSQVIRILRSPDGDIAEFLFHEIVTHLQHKEELSYKVLMASAIFENPPIREALIEVAGLRDKDFSCSDEEIGNALKYLKRVNLITYADGRYHILPLTQSYIKSEHSKHPDFVERARERWVKYYLKTVKKIEFVDWGSQKNSESYFLFLQPEWENLMSVIEWCADKNDYLKVKEFWEYLHEQAYGYGYWQDRIKWLEWIRVQAKRREDWSTFAEVATHASWSYMRWYSTENLRKAEKLLKEAWNLKNFVTWEIQDFTAHNTAKLMILQENYTQARNWLKKQEEIINDRNNTSTFGDEQKKLYKARRLATVSYRQAEILYLEKKYEEAKKLFQQVEEKAKKINWDRYVNYAQNWLADIAIIENRWDDAEELLKAGLDAAKENGLKRRIFCYQASFARLEMAKDNSDEAKRFAKEAIDGFTQIGMIKEAKDVKDLIKDLISEQE